MTQAFADPPWTRTQAGAPRRVGIELEMNGIDLDAAAACVAAPGFAVESRGRYERRILGDPAGAWTVEVDSSFLKRMGRAPRDRGTLKGGVETGAEAAVALVVGSVMPVEAISPPLPLARLPEVEALVARLRAAGARGSTDALVNAFGLQLNPEAPRTDADALAAILKAFLCLHDWLAARARVDFSRRLTTFVDPFPRAYVRLAVRPEYRPDLGGLIDDYLRWNPTRNRALDLLPLLAHLDEARVREAVRDPRIKARPAFHYRLPNCEIGRPGWRIAPSWNDWVEVERLAADPGRLGACGEAYRAFLSRSRVGRWLGDWAGEVERAWLDR
jgi:hypothetical protein